MSQIDALLHYIFSDRLLHYTIDGLTVGYMLNHAIGAFIGFVILCAGIFILDLFRSLLGTKEQPTQEQPAQKRCPHHGIPINEGHECPACVEQRRKEQIELAEKRKEAWLQLRASEIKRLSEAWLSNASTYLEMSPWEFEDAIAELFRRLGFTVIQTPRSRDGGKDAILYRHGKKSLLECKRYASTQTVGRRDLQIFYAAMREEGAVGGYFVTTGTFTSTAREYAAIMNIKLIGYTSLPFLANKAYPVPADFSQASVMCCQCGDTITLPVEILPANALCSNGHTVTSNIVTADLRVLREGEVPYCPECGAPMRIVEWSRGEFWGCSSYPKCEYSKPLRPCDPLPNSRFYAKEFKF